MKIKRFLAPDMRQAMQKVREEQGPDAVILSTQRIESGIEIVAALDYDESLVRGAFGQPRVPLNSEPISATSSTTVLEESGDPGVVVSLSAAITSLGSDRSVKSNSFTGDVPSDISTESLIAPSAEPVSEISPVITEAAPIANEIPIANDGLTSEITTQIPPIEPINLSGATPGLQGLEQEINQLRQMIDLQFSSLAWNDLARRRPLRARILREFTRYGIETDVASTLISHLPADISLEQSHHLPLELLTRSIMVSDHELDDEGGVVALVGPTGVGKTTTIAKLAARFVLRHGRNQVALVTTDDFRIGAEDQLLRYGRLLGIPVYTAYEPEKLHALLERLDDRRLVLIDTPGMGLRDARLADVIRMLQSNSTRIRTCLTLAANAQAAALDEAVRAYAETQPIGCILTKLDEAPNLGGALSVTIRHRLRIDYTTDGQHVPEDIALADAQHLIHRVVNLSPQHGLPDEMIMAERFGRMAATFA